MLLGNKARREIAIKQCKQYVDREEILSKVEVTNLSIDDFCLREVLIPYVLKDSPRKKVWQKS